jgi:hypothetical protein
MGRRRRRRRRQDVAADETAQKDISVVGLER